MRGSKKSSTNSKASSHIVPILIITLLLLLGVLAFFASVTDYFPGDVAISKWIQSWRTPWLDRAMEWVSFLGTTTPAIITVALVVVVLILITGRWEGTLLGFVMIIAFATNRGLKLAIGRPRPDSAIVQVTTDASGNAFPSAHTMHMMVFLGLLVLLISMYLKPKWLQRTLYVLLLALLLATGTSRIYLGVHWFSDVIGGYLFGLVILAATMWLYKNKFARPRAPRNRHK